MTSSSPGGWPAACTGSDGHELGEAVEHEARPVVERGHRRQVLVLALAARPTTNGRSHADVPCARGREHEPEHERAAEQRGGEDAGRAAAPAATSATAATKHGIATISHGSARGPYAPMNGGCGTPSRRPLRVEREPDGDGRGATAHHARARPRAHGASREPPRRATPRRGRRGAPASPLPSSARAPPRAASRPRARRLRLGARGRAARARRPAGLAGAHRAARRPRRARCGVRLSEASAPSRRSTEPATGCSTGGRSARTCREPIDVAMVERGTRIAVLCGRERVLDLYDAKTLEAARAGRRGHRADRRSRPTASSFFTSRTSLGEALLVYHLRPFELIRRVHLGGGPYAIAYDRGAGACGSRSPAPTGSSTTPPAAGPCSATTLPSIRDARDGHPSTATP